MKTIFNLILLCLCAAAYGQLSFCTASKGLPILFEDFGSGSNYGPPLIPGFIRSHQISIFDRYGKLLIMLHAAKPSWNGTLNGNLLPATNYWNKAFFDDQTESTGHFSLIR